MSIDKLDSWEARFAELVAFKEKHGHANPPSGNGPIGNWASKQRTAKAKGRLDPERERRLTELGFSWSLHADAWEHCFAELVAHKEKHGHANAPYSTDPLGEWVRMQRAVKARGCMAPERERRLNELGFVWTPSNDTWETRFAELVAYKEKYGHASPPLGMGALGTWVHKQRVAMARGQLAPERERRLEELGFAWKKRIRASWETRFAELMAFKEKHGHANALRSTGPLGRWVNTQRRMKAKGHLDPERERRLSELGFSWAPFGDAWETRFAELVAFKEKHGHATPPRSTGLLGTWVSNQREVKAKGHLAPERKQRLDAIGLSWSLRGHVWETRFAELVAYKEKHGHASPPQSTGPLGIWAKKQRYAKAKGRLSPERQRRLGELGFSWTPFDDAWETRFAELVAFKEKHGHATPPRSTGLLNKWANRQRVAKTKGYLDPERERRLNELGFVWRIAPSRRV